MEILGWLGTIMFLLGGLFKIPRQTIRLYAIGNFLYVVFYFTSDFYVLGLCMLITLLRSLSALFLNDKQNFYIAISSGLVGTTLLLFTVDTALDNLILVANIAVTISALYRDDVVRFRGCLCISQILWIVHSLYFGIYSMAFTCVLILATSLYVIADEMGYLKVFKLKATVPADVEYDGRNCAQK